MVHVCFKVIYQKIASNYQLVDLALMHAQGISMMLHALS
jgi:hypothetical protein